jgi:hypothetical protein
LTAEETKTQTMGNIAALAKSSGNDNNDVDFESKTNSMPSPNATDIVLQKITSSKQFQVKLGHNLNKMKHFARQISDSEELKNSYLSTDWLHTVELYRENSNVEEEVEEQEKQKKKPLVDLSSKSEANDFFNNLMDFDITENELNTVKNQQFAEKIRIKLLIAETADTTPKRAMRQLVSPLLNTFNVLPELGMFHSALIIGPWKLEFNDSGVVVPRKIISSAAVLTADIDHITTVNRFNDITNKLAACIVKWNTTMQYKETGGDKSKYGNCQDFVDDVLATLDIKLNFSGPLAHFIERLRKTGKCNLQFEPDNSFSEKFSLTEKVYKFTDHDSLDKFVHELMAKNSNLMTDHRSEWALLKSFDRAFWLKHMKFPERQEYCPLMAPTENPEVHRVNWYVLLLLLLLLLQLYTYIFYTVHLEIQINFHSLEYKINIL